jgi:hypothetical protein
MGQLCQAAATETPEAQLDATGIKLGVKKKTFQDQNPNVASQGQQPNIEGTDV